MNIGSAVSVHEDEADQIVVIMTSPTGRVVNSSIPTQATPIRAKPDPDAGAQQSEQDKEEEDDDIDAFSMLSLSVALVGKIAGDAVIAPEQHVDQVISQGDGQNDRAEQHRRLRYP